MSHGTNESLWTRLARPVLEFPLDLAILVFTLAVVSLALVQPSIYGTPFAVALGVPIALLAPGYAVVSFLFPGVGPSHGPQFGSPARIRRDGISRVERLALSFGVSLCLIPLFGLALAAAGVEFGLLPVLGVVVSFTVVTAVFGVVRRFTIPKDERFSVSIRGGVSGLHTALFDAETGADVVLNVALALSVVVALSAVGFAFTAPQDGEEFSQLSLLTQTDDGEFVAENYPEQFSPGETKPLYVSVTNHEEEPVEYTVVAELQRVEQRGGNARTVEQQEMKRFEQRLPAGGSWRKKHQVAPTMAGENLRLVYLLYEGDPPTNPSIENADEHAYIWITVGANETE